MISTATAVFERKTLGGILLGFLVTATVVVGCRARSEASLTPDEARAIAEEAYIFSFPILESYKMLFAQALFEGSGAYEAPLNVMKHKTVLLGPDYTLIVRPNNDTFYSIVWLDLRGDPIVISVPAIPLDRYYSFQLIDLYTHNFAYIGSRATGPDAGDYLIAGPRWDGDVPDGIDGVIRSETELAVALGRTAVFGEDDVPAAMTIQEQYKATPLSQFMGGAPPAPKPELSLPPYNPQQASSAGFVALVNALLPFIVPDPSEAELWKRFAAIGVGNSEFSVEELDPEIRSAIDAGVAAAIEKIQGAVSELGRRENGWSLTEGAFGTREAMQGKYLTRSAAAFFGLWGNSLEEAFYPDAAFDADGDSLDGSKHSYVLHFAADALPPVKGFWSLSMYKLPEQLFIRNPIDRYTIGDRTRDLEYGEDGSLTLYIQHESPGAGREANWLPAPDGPFSVTARLYWPDPDALDPLWVPPAIEKTN